MNLPRLGILSITTFAALSLLTYYLLDPKLPRPTRLDYAIRIVSSLHALIAVIFGVLIVTHPNTRNDVIYGGHPLTIQAVFILGGYVVYDTVAMMTREWLRGRKVVNMLFVHHVLLLIGGATYLVIARLIDIPNAH